jgi:hypothetical protein
MIIEILSHYSDNIKTLTKHLQHNNIHFIKTTSNKGLTNFQIGADDFISALKFILKNKIRYDCKNKYGIIKLFLKEKRFDDLTFMLQKKIIDAYIFENFTLKIFSKYDLETINYILGLDIKINMEIALRVVCWREDDNIDIVRIIWEQIMHCNNKKFSHYFLLKQPLLNAAEKGNYDIVRFLVDCKPNKCILNEAADLALEHNHIDTVEYLVEHGATLGLDDDIFIKLVSKEESMTSMIDFLTKYKLISDEDLGRGFVAACKTGSLETVISLVEAGVNLKMYISKALHVSRSRPHIVEYLKSLDDF